MQQTIQEKIIYLDCQQPISSRSTRKARTIDLSRLQGLSLASKKSQPLEMRTLLPPPLVLLCPARFAAFDFNILGTESSITIAVAASKPITMSITIIFRLSSR